MPKSLRYGQLCSHESESASMGIMKPTFDRLQASRGPDSFNDSRKNADRPASGILGDKCNKAGHDSRRLNESTSHASYSKMEYSDSGIRLIDYTVTGGLLFWNKHHSI